MPEGFHRERKAGMAKLAAAHLTFSNEHTYAVYTVFFNQMALRLEIHKYSLYQ